MEEELKKVEAQPTPAPEPPLASAPKDVAEEKAALPPPPGAAAAAADESKALAVVEAESKFSVKWESWKLCYVVKTKECFWLLVTEVPETVEKKPSGGSIDRGV